MMGKPMLQMLTILIDSIKEKVSQPEQAMKKKEDDAKKKVLFFRYCFL